MNDANLGTLPPNGTVCRTDHSGSNNIFIRNLSNNKGDGNGKLKLGLGLGFGLGLMLLLGLFFVIYFVRRRNQRSEDSDRIILVDQKDRSLFDEISK